MNKAIFGFYVRWSKRLVTIHRRRCVFIWRRDPNFTLSEPVWKLHLPFNIVIEKWRSTQ